MVIRFYLRSSAPGLTYRVMRCLLWGGTLLFSGTAWANNPMPLSMETAALFALHKNPDVMIALEKNKQANFAVTEARSSYYPQISATFKAGQEYNDPSAAGTLDPLGQPSQSYDAKVIVTQLLFDGFVTDSEVERRKQLVQSADLQARITMEKILYDTIGAYVDVWRAQRAQSEAERFVDVVTGIANKIKLMAAAGAESKTKKEYVDSRLAAAKSTKNSTEADLAKSLSELESLTGVLPPFEAQRPEQFDPTARQMDAYFSLARQENAGMQLNQSDRAALERQEEGQSGKYLPSLSLQLEAKQSQDVGGRVGRVRGASAMVVMNYNIFDGFAREAETGRLRSQISENDFRRDKLMRDLQKSVRQAYNQLLATKRDLAANIKEVIASESLQMLYQQQFELGEGDVINIIEGEERLHSAHQKGLRLEAEMVLNSYALLRQIGALQKERFCVHC